MTRIPLIANLGRTYRDLSLRSEFLCAGLISAMLFLISCTASPANVQPTATSTAAPTKTTVPTRTPIPTPTSVVQLSKIPAGDCYNPYFPAIEGLKLTYRNEVEGESDIETTVTFVDVNESAFATEVIGQDLKGLIVWQCGSDGILATQHLEGYITAPIFHHGDADLTSTGLTLPAVDKIVLGQKWSTEYSSISYGAIEGPSGPLAVTLDMWMNHVVASKTSVESLDGTELDGYVVESKGRATMLTKLGESVLNDWIGDVEYTSVYAENLGLVSQDYTVIYDKGTKTMKSVTTLVDIEFSE